MIREDNVTLETLREDLVRDHIPLKEYVTRSEGAALFTVAINKQLLNTYKAYDSDWNKVATTVTKGDGEGRTVRFPSMFGCNPQYIPELSEVPFGDLDITSTTVEAEKFGLRMGISNEMIDDNEVSLISWITSRMGTKMAELQDQEFFKMLDTHGTGGAGVDSTVVCYIGNRNRGVYYTTSTHTNNLSATAAYWEAIISTGMNTLKTQTVTLRGETYRYPVYADTIIVNAREEIALRKILNAATVVMATGIGAVPGSNAAGQNAGTNIFNGMLKLVATPYIGRGQAYITQAGRGLVMLMREPIRVERQPNWAFEAEEAKIITRFMPAEIEERSQFVISLGTA